jgi:hypothetical protein
MKNLHASDRGRVLVLTRCARWCSDGSFRSSGKISITFATGSGPRLIRLTLQKLLVEEEDKLAKDVGLLGDLAREIVKCQKWIEKQQALVEVFKRDGRDVTTARALLNAVTESLIIHQEYRQRVATRLEKIELAFF